MYHLLFGIYETLTRKDEFNVVILGLDNAGKTTFLEQVKHLFRLSPEFDPAKINPTVGQNIGRIPISSSVLQFWDLGGQRDFRAIWPKYYQDCHALVFIVDSTDTERAEEMRDVFKTIVQDFRLEGIPVLVLANKQDDVNAMPVEQIKELVNQVVPESRVSESAVMPVSALQGTGVRQATDWLLIRVNSRRPTQS